MAININGNIIMLYNTIIIIIIIITIWFITLLMTVNIKIWVYKPTYNGLYKAIL